MFPYRPSDFLSSFSRLVSFLTGVQKTARPLSIGGIDSLPGELRPSLLDQLDVRMDRELIDPNPNTPPPLAPPTQAQAELMGAMLRTAKRVEARRLFADAYAPEPTELLEKLIHSGHLPGDILTRWRRFLYGEAHNVKLSPLNDVVPGLVIRHFRTRVRELLTRAHMKVELVPSLGHAIAAAFVGPTSAYILLAKESLHGTLDEAEYWALHLYCHVLDSRGRSDGYSVWIEWDRDDTTCDQCGDTIREHTYWKREARLNDEAVACKISMLF